MMEPLVSDALVESPPLPLRRLSVAQYQRMIAEGILTEADRVELLEGLLVDKMTKNRPHSLSTRLAHTALETVVPSGWFVDSQEPITTGDSQPEPDVLVVRGQPRDYAEAPPPAAALGIVVEVADSSLQYDRVNKQRIYARAGIPVYWIINLVDQQIEVYSRPVDDRYQERRVYTAVDTVPVVLDGAEVGRLPARDLLP
jgi:Uma2 family endonuclease